MTTREVPQGVTVRRVERKDLAQVRRIERAVFPQPWPGEAFERFLDEPGFLVAVSQPSELAGESRAGGGHGGGGDGTEVAGYVVADVVSSYGTDLGHVKDVAVAPNYRRRGVGTALMSRALSILAERGVRRVKLEVREGNAAAQSLYDRFGFHLRRRLPHYYADGEDALVFVAEVEK